MTKPRIWAVMIYWNEEKYLQKNLYRIFDFVDGLILVDGAFQGFDKEADQYSAYMSCDCSSDVIHQLLSDYVWGYEDIIWLTNMGYSRKVSQEFCQSIALKGWSNEIEKRTWAINQVPDGDYFFIIDADEILLGDPEFFRRELYAPVKDNEITRNVGVVHFPEDTGWFLMPRVYLKEPNMKYEATHANIFVGNKPISWDAPYNNQRMMRSILIIHETAFYDDFARKNQKWNYQARRSSEENVKRWRRDNLLKDIGKERLGAIEDLMKAKKATGVGFTTHDNK